MPLKSADDKSKRLALLEDLQSSPMLDSTQKKWLRDELTRFKKGIQGERESAHYLDHYFKDAENNFVLHDLRFVIEGEVTQIDHLIINRTGFMILLETKNYACNLVINESGEFTAEYDNARFGIASPIEQSLRHERVLSKLLERLNIVGRTQKMIDIHHVVLLHPKAIIVRPTSTSFDSSNVIKADQFPTWHKSFVDKIRGGAIFTRALNMRSLDTIKEWGEKLIGQHRPADLIALPDFMRPREQIKTIARTPPVTVPQPLARTSAAVQTLTQNQPASNVNVVTEEPAKRLICAHCSIKITFPEGKFCWSNAKRFGGLAYCRAHQALI